MPTYRIDLHSHCQGDPVDDLKHTIHQHIDRASECGLHAVALTWHGKVFDDEEAIAYARDRGVLLIPGVETNLNGAQHTLVLNVKPGDIPGKSTLDDLRAVRQGPDRFIIAPHPYYPHWSCLRSVIDEHPELFDGIEWSHFDSPWIPAMLSPNERARKWALRHGKPLIACSDAHTLQSLGYCYSEVEAEEFSIPAIFEALRAGRVRFTPHPITFSYALYQSKGLVANLWDRMIGAVK